MPTPSTDPALPPTRSGGSCLSEVTVVVASRNRRDHVIATVRRLRALPEQPPVIVIDDGSSDGTAAAVRSAFSDPGVVVLAPGSHRGVAAARNVGVRAALTPYVAFADDDSWWAPGALGRVGAYFAAHPRLGLIAARILVGHEARIDPTCVAMAASPLPAEGLPGPRVLGFVACGAAVRRRAYLDAGGFPEPYIIGGEERPLALALAAAGWDLAYLEDVVAHHHPAAAARDSARSRDRRVARNDIWTAWRHRPAASAVRETVEIVRAVPAADRAALLGAAFAGLAWALRTRTPVPPEVERHRRVLEASPDHAPARRYRS